MDLTTLSEIIRPLWTVWLMVIFFSIVAWAFWPKNKARFEKDALMVFNDDKNGD